MDLYIWKYLLLYFLERGMLAWMSSENSMSHNNTCNDFYTMWIRSGFIQEFADKAVPSSDVVRAGVLWDFNILGCTKGDRKIDCDYTLFWIIRVAHGLLLWLREGTLLFLHLLQSCKQWCHFLSVAELAILET